MGLVLPQHLCEPGEHWDLWEQGSTGTGEQCSFVIDSNSNPK